MGSEEIAAILERICDGRGVDADIVRLEDLAEYVHESARCDIGLTSPHPILDAIRSYCNKFIDAVREAKPIPRGEYVVQVTAPCVSACPDRLISRLCRKDRMDQWKTEGDSPQDMLHARHHRPCLCKGLRVRASGSIDEPIAIKHLKASPRT
jgi:formate dehydrogenase beta subunit